MYEELNVLVAVEKPLDPCPTWLPLASRNPWSQTHSNPERRLGRDKCSADSFRLSGAGQSSPADQELPQNPGARRCSTHPAPPPPPPVRCRGGSQPASSRLRPAPPAPFLLPSPTPSPPPQTLLQGTLLFPRFGILVNELYFTALCG